MKRVLAYPDCEGMIRFRPFYWARSDCDTFAGVGIRGWRRWMQSSVASLTSIKG
jgi:hypothetical protein